MRGLEGRTVLVTGGGGGIGGATCRRFAAEGAKVGVLDLDADAAGRVASSISSAGGRAEAIRCDITDRASVDAAIATAEASLGPVDVLVNNAGAFAMAPFAKTSVAMFDDMIATNLRSAFLVTHAFLPAMLRRRRGDIFFMSSIAGLGAYPQATAYCAAKFGVTGLAKVLRAETKDTGIRVGARGSKPWRPS